MRRKFKIKGDFNSDVRTSFVLELNSPIESRKIGDNLFTVTVFDIRENFNQIIKKLGLEIVKEFD